MPTFHFYVNGERQDDKMIRGAKLDAIKEVLSSLPQSQHSFSGTGYSLGGATQDASDSSDNTEKPKRRRNPWADPNFAAKKMGVDPNKKLDKSKPKSKPKEKKKVISASSQYAQSIQMDGGGAKKQTTAPSAVSKP